MPACLMLFPGLLVGLAWWRIVAARLAGRCEPGADGRPRLPGLAGPGDSCGQGALGGSGLLVGGADPVQDLKLGSGGQGDRWGAFTDT